MTSTTTVFAPRRRIATAAIVGSLIVSACGGGSDTTADSSDSAAQGAAESDPNDPCGALGFFGTASRDIDGEAQAAGDYTGEDFIDARSRGSEKIQLVVASFELPETFSTPSPEAGGVVMQVLIAPPDTLTVGTAEPIEWGSLLPPSIKNIGGSVRNGDDLDGTYTLLEPAGDTICVEVAYADDYHRIDGVFNVPNQTG